MIQARNLTKIYTRSHSTVRAMDDVSLSIDRGEFVVVHGASGSGKSTLLLTLGGMLHPTQGTVIFQGTNIYDLSSVQRNQYRKYSVGFIFQKFFLVPYLTALDNIRMPLVLRHDSETTGRNIFALSERLGVSDRLNHRPAELSAGEQQRVAMVRTLAGSPEIILADEPTGNLDQENAAILADCLREECERGHSVVVVTHDRELLDLGDRVLHLRSGRLARNDAEEDDA